MQHPCLLFLSGCRDCPRECLCLSVQEKQWKKKDSILLIFGTVIKSLCLAWIGRIFSTSIFTADKWLVYIAFTESQGIFSLGQICQNSEAKIWKPARRHQPVLCSLLKHAASAKQRASYLETLCLNEIKGFKLNFFESNVIDHVARFCAMKIERP